MCVAVRCLCVCCGCCGCSTAPDVIGRGPVVEIGARSAPDKRFWKAGMAAPGLVWELEPSHLLLLQPAQSGWDDGGSLHCASDVCWCSV